MLIQSKNTHLDNKHNVIEEEYMPRVQFSSRRNITISFPSNIRLQSPHTGLGKKKNPIHSL